MNVLVVDDEDKILRVTSAFIEKMGHSPLTARSPSQADKLRQENDLDAAFIDIRLGRESGLDYLERLREDDFSAPVILFTGYSNVEEAVESMRRGAFNYLQKPLVGDDLQNALATLEKQAPRARDAQVRGDQPLETLTAGMPLVAADSLDDAMRRAYDRAMRAARCDVSVLLSGPSGSGKSVLASRMHHNSRRANEPFVTVNCPSLSAELLDSQLFGHVKGAFTGAVNDTWGKVAAAEGGTLFLDEIGDLPGNVQAKLLRLLQERAYERLGETKTREANIRVIAATNRDLRAKIENGRFREDLFYRLKVIEVAMPALAERPLDIVPLAQRYLDYFCQLHGFKRRRLSKDAENALMRHGWPGNLRELRNAMEQVAVLAEDDTVTPQDLPEEIMAESTVALPLGGEISIETIEREHIRRLLERKPSLEAAKTLGIDPSTLYRKRKKYELL